MHGHVQRREVIEAWDIVIGSGWSSAIDYMEWVILIVE